jgi:dephospho-CoA kinase
MLKEKLDEARKAGRDVAVEVPLLFELGLEKYFDVVVMVFSEPETRIGRLEKRDRVGEREAAALIDLQMPDREKMKRADFVVRNTGSMERLEKDVKILHRKLFDPA